MFSRSLNAALGENAKIIEKLQNSQSIIEKGTTESDALNNQLLALVQDIVNKSKTNNAVIRECVPQLRSAETMVNECESNIQTAVTAMNTGHAECQETITVNMQSIRKTHGAIDEKMATMAKCRLDDVHRFADKNKMAEAELSAQISEVNAQKNVMVDDVGMVIDVAEINATAEMQRLVDDLQAENERIEDSQNVVVEMHHDLNEIQANSVKALDDHVAASRSRLQSFQSNEFKTYVPTGQTPNKRDYKYPKVLATTSPATAIIRRFWNEHDGGPLECSMAICEVISY